jgi:hypothetical protein
VSKRNASTVFYISARPPRLERISGYVRGNPSDLPKRTQALLVKGSINTAGLRKTLLDISSYISVEIHVMHV